MNKAPFSSIFYFLFFSRWFLVSLHFFFLGFLSKITIVFDFIPTILLSLCRVLLFLPTAYMHLYISLSASDIIIEPFQATSEGGPGFTGAVRQTLQLT